MEASIKNLDENQGFDLEHPGRARMNRAFDLFYFRKMGFPPPRSAPRQHS